MATIDPIIEQLKCAVGQDYVVHMPEDLIVYEYDGSTGFRGYENRMESW